MIVYVRFFIITGTLNPGNYARILRNPICDVYTR